MPNAIKKKCLVLALFCTAGAAHAAALPEIAADDLFRAGQTLTLRGLRASESIATDLVFVNLAKSGNRCTLALADGNGAGLSPVVSLALKALERRSFLDVFEGLGGPAGLRDALATVSCSQDFSAYAVLTDRARGLVDLVAPEESFAESSIQGLPAPAEACSTGAVCFDAPGVVHIPDPPPGPELPVGRVAFPAPTGVAKRLRLSINVTVADWYPQQPSGKHLIYWFVINKNIDMPGLLYFRGPGKDQAFARHGIGLTHPQKIKILKPFAAKVGHTYHVDNDYDMVHRTYTVTVTDLAPGGTGVTLQGKTNVASYAIKPGSKFLIDMGFYPDKVETEVPSYGWKYADVHVEVFLQ